MNYDIYCKYHFCIRACSCARKNQEQTMIKIYWRTFRCWNRNAKLSRKVLNEAASTADSGIVCCNGFNWEPFPLVIFWSGIINRWYILLIIIYCNRTLILCEQRKTGTERATACKVKKKASFTTDTTDLLLSCFVEVLLWLLFPIAILLQAKTSIYQTHLDRNTSHRILIYNYSHNSEGCHQNDSRLCCKLAFRVNDKYRSRHRTRRALSAFDVPVYREYRTDVSKNSNLSSCWHHSLQRCRAGERPFVAVVFFSRYLPPLTEAGGRLLS